MTEPESRRVPEPDAVLAALRVDETPRRDLWAGIAERIADPAERDHLTLAEPLASELAALRAEQAPPRDLWEGVAARIAVKRSPRRRAPWWAAAASLAASLLVVFGLVVDRADPPRDAVTRAPLRPSADAFAAAVGSARGGDEAAALQHASYHPMPREARALMRANLKIVDTAEAQIERAMSADPDDAAYLQALLDSARQRQQGLRAALADPPSP
ncbi:MAG: hypothetical protein NTZ11_00715 [Gammaproteobacteria bacterium]|nr:hypothetical protein [Gammaproteobacteria bacterium]